MPQRVSFRKVYGQRDPAREHVELAKFDITEPSPTLRHLFDAGLVSRETAFRTMGIDPGMMEATVAKPASSKEMFLISSRNMGKTLAQQRALEKGEPREWVSEYLSIFTFDAEKREARRAMPIPRVMNYAPSMASVPCESPISNVRGWAPSTANAREQMASFLRTRIDTSAEPAPVTPTPEPTVSEVLETTHRRKLSLD